MPAYVPMVAVLGVLALLQREGGVLVYDLTCGLDITERTLRRYLSTLEGAGYTVHRSGEGLGRTLRIDADDKPSKLLKELERLIDGVVA